jgi:hypothetical protein
MGGERPLRKMAESSRNTQPSLRVGEGVLVRSDRGTWLIHLRISSKDGEHSLQVPIGKHRVIDRLARELRADEPH